jgi:hypothetical protein
MASKTLNTIISPTDTNRTLVYTAPTTATSAIVFGGTLTNTDAITKTVKTATVEILVSAGVYKRVGGQVSVPYAIGIGLPKITLNPGQSIYVTISQANTVDCLFNIMEIYSNIALGGTGSTVLEALNDHIANLNNPHGTTATQIGLGSVNNTSDANKPVSVIQQAALDLKASLTGATFTGTVNGITKTMVGLASVDNTADTAKPVSTAQQNALNLKLNLSGGTMSGGLTISSNTTTNSPALILGNTTSSAYIQMQGTNLYFINAANNAVNASITDAGAVSFPRARPTWAGLTPWDSGNFNPANYAPLSTFNADITSLQSQITGNYNAYAAEVGFLQSEINSVSSTATTAYNVAVGRMVPDSVSTGGWASGNSQAPYFSNGTAVGMIQQRYLGGIYDVFFDGALKITSGGTQYFFPINGSDARLKENIVDSTISALDVVNKIKFKQFNFKESSVFDHTKVHKVGVIAQELREVEPTFVIPSDSYYQLDLLPMLNHALKAIQELSAQVEDLKTQVAALNPKV